MQTTMKTIRKVAVAAAALAALIATSSFAEAANYGAMSCSQLWYARNSIYAQNGYCFKTARARSVFGPGCFPPFGKLSGYEQQEINDIQYWESRKGC
jgi:hypothetical protein